MLAEAWDLRCSCVLYQEIQNAHRSQSHNEKECIVRGKNIYVPFAGVQHE